MIPSAFVRLDAFPLTAAGKIDRLALPAPARQRPELKKTAFVAPRTPIERSMARIWTEVIGLDAIGVHDNFFALGGHSLLATRLTSRVRDTFHIDVPIRAVFEGPTVASLCEFIENLRRTVQADPTVSLSHVDDEVIIL